MEGITKPQDKFVAKTRQGTPKTGLRKFFDYICVPRRGGSTVPKRVSESQSGETLRFVCTSGETVLVTDASELYNLDGWYWCAQYHFKYPKDAKKHDEIRMLFIPREKLQNGEGFAAEPFAVVYSNFPFGYVWIGQIAPIFDGANLINDITKVEWQGRGIQFPFGVDTVYEGEWNKSRESGEGILHHLDARGKITGYTHDPKDPDAKRIEIPNPKYDEEDRLRAAEKKRCRDAGLPPPPPRKPVLCFPTFENFSPNLRLVMVAETRRLVGGFDVWKSKCKPEDVFEVQTLEARHAEMREAALVRMTDRNHANDKIPTFDENLETLYSKECDGSGKFTMNYPSAFHPPPEPPKTNEESTELLCKAFGESVVRKMREKGLDMKCGIFMNTKSGTVLKEAGTLGEDAQEAIARVMEEGMKQYPDTPSQEKKKKKKKDIATPVVNTLPKAERDKATAELLAMDKKEKEAKKKKDQKRARKVSPKKQDAVVVAAVQHAEEPKIVVQAPLQEDVIPESALPLPVPSDDVVIHIEPVREPEVFPTSNFEDAEDAVQQLERLKDSLTCVVCLAAERRTIFLPCKHLCTCSACAAALTQCPVCRAGIKQKIDAFI